MAGSLDTRQRLILAMPWVFVLIWSTGFIVARLAMPHASPMTFLCWRYAFSVVCFFVWVKAAGLRFPNTLSACGHLAVTGVLMHAGYLGGVWAAVHFGMGAGLSALVVGLQPVLTGIWLSYAGDRVSGRQWLGLALGLLGLLMVVANKLTHVGEVSPLTLALVTVGLLSITVGTLYQKRYVKPCDVRTASTVQLMAAFLVTIPFAWLEDSPLVWVPDLVIAMTW